MVRALLTLCNIRRGFPASIKHKSHEAIVKPLILLVVTINAGARNATNYLTAALIQMQFWVKLLFFQDLLLVWFLSTF